MEKDSDKRTRRSPDEIKQEILSVLTDGPKTTEEIIQKTASHFPITKKFIDELIQDGEIVESQTEAGKVYLRKDYPIFYRIPISKKDRNRTLAILQAIVAEYKKQSKNDIFPFRTIIQKIAVDYIENNEPELPVMNFKFGKICCLAYEESISQKYESDIKLTTINLEKIRESVKKFIGKNATEAKMIQYKEPGMEFYKIKEEILNLFLEAKEHPDKLSEKIIEWSIYYPEKLGNVSVYFDKFIYSSTNILRLKNIDSRVSQLKETFDALWNMLMINYFFETARGFIEKDKIKQFDEIKNDITFPELSHAGILLDDMESEVTTIPESEFKKIKMNNKTAKLLHLLLED